MFSSNDPVLATSSAMSPSSGRIWYCIRHAYYFYACTVYHILGKRHMKLKVYFYISKWKNWGGIMDLLFLNLAAQGAFGIFPSTYNTKCTMHMKDRPTRDWVVQSVPPKNLKWQLCRNGVAWSESFSLALTRIHVPVTSATNRPDQEYISIVHFERPLEPSGP